MISFNNIPNTLRNPGVYAEVDNSRALQSLVANPHKVLIIGQKNVDTNNPTKGTAENATIYSISRAAVADGYFGTESLLSRMCNTFKDNNPNTELYAMALSGGTVQAQAQIDFSVLLSFNGGSCSTFNEPVNLMINGQNTQLTLTQSMLATSVAAAYKVLISEAGTYPVTASASGAFLILSVLNSGTFGNYLDTRFNYFDGQSFPTCFDSNVTASFLSNFGIHVVGVGAADLADAWSVIENEQYHYIAQPYIDATNLGEIEDELETRFKPLIDKQGHGFTAVRGTQASCTTLGNSRNSPHNTIMGAYDSPTAPEEWAAALCAQAAFNLNNDAARPLHYLKLSGILSPPEVNKFTQTERNTLLYDGIATWLTDTSNNILIERCITSYQSNAAGIPDPSYLDIQTLATLGEIRFQFKSRMVTRFVVPRFKLASDTFPAQPGMKVARPKDVKAEIIALFTSLRDIGLVENLDEFVENLVVERNATDVNRVDVLLPPDLINQFRILAGLLQFVL